MMEDRFTQEDDKVPKCDAKMVKHKCKDGKERMLQPVYFREVDSQTGNRHFVRRAWYCGHCGYGDGSSHTEG